MSIYNRPRSIALCLRNRKTGGILSEENVLNRFAEDQLASREKAVVKCNLPGSPRSTFLVAFSPDGKKIASTHGDHTIRITDLKTGKCLETLTGHPRTPWSIVFHPSKPDLLASGCLGGMVRVWDLTTGKTIVYSPSNDRPIASLAFHPVDMVLVIATGNQLEFWNWEQPTPFASVSTSAAPLAVKLIRFDRTGNRILTGIRNPLGLSLFGTRLGGCRGVCERHNGRRVQAFGVGQGEIRNLNIDNSVNLHHYRSSTAIVVSSANNSSMRFQTDNNTLPSTSSMLLANDEAPLTTGHPTANVAVRNNTREVLGGQSSNNIPLQNTTPNTWSTIIEEAVTTEQPSHTVPPSNIESGQTNAPQSANNEPSNGSSMRNNDFPESRRAFFNRSVCARTRATVARIPHNIQAGIDYVIAEGFAASGYSIAMASNMTYTTYQLQLWDFIKLDIPNIEDSEANVIVKRCKISNDASIDISSDDRLLCAIVPNLESDLTFGSICVFSLEKHNLGQCLFSRKFCLNAISVSLSPLGQYLLVGMASLRTFFVASSVTMAQVFKLNKTTKTMHHVSNLKCPTSVDDISIGTNAAFWVPSCGCGMVYGTNKGELYLCHI